MVEPRRRKASCGDRRFQSGHRCSINGFRRLRRPCDHTRNTFAGAWNRRVTSLLVSRMCLGVPLGSRTRRAAFFESRKQLVATLTRWLVSFVTWYFNPTWNGHSAGVQSGRAQLQYAFIYSPGGRDNRCRHRPPRNHSRAFARLPDYCAECRLWHKPMRYEVATGHGLTLGTRSYPFLIEVQNT
jgi:hypothetical protein